MAVVAVGLLQVEAVVVVELLLKVEEDKEVVDNHLTEVVDSHLMEVVDNNLRDDKAAKVDNHPEDREAVHLHNVVTTVEVTETKAVTNMKLKCSMNHLKILILLKNTSNLRLFTSGINFLVKNLNKFMINHTESILQSHKDQLQPELF